MLRIAGTALSDTCTVLDLSKTGPRFRSALQDLTSASNFVIYVVWGILTGNVASRN